MVPARRRVGMAHFFVLFCRRFRRMCIAVLDGLFVTYDFRTVRGDFGWSSVPAVSDTHAATGNSVFGTRMGALRSFSSFWGFLRSSSTHQESYQN